MMAVAFVSAAFAVSQEDIDNLPKEKQKEYYDNRLTLDIVTESAGGAWLLPFFGGSTSMVAAAGQSSRVWYPYRGPQKIRRIEFYQMAGAEEQYRKITKRNQNVMVTGISSIIAGGISLALTGLAEPRTDEHTGLLLTGMTGIGIGLEILVIGLIFKDRDKVPASYAQHIADRYNDELYQSLR